MASTRHHRGRRIGTAALCIALAGGAAVAIVAHKPKTSSAGVAPSIFKTATVSRGALTTTERIDGVVQLSSTLTVLHRIEGQTSSSTGSAPNAAGGAAPATTGRTNTAAAASALRLADCPSTTVATTTTTPTTTTPTTTTPPTTTPNTAPVDTTPAATSTTTTTTVAPTEPATTVSATTVPAVPCDTTTTTTVAPPDTSVANAGGRTGGARGGSGGTAGASRSTTGGTGAAASTARITQTVTSIIAANTPIQQGDVLYTVDGAPVVALDGILPAWRTMSTTSVDGPDVAQLEASLVSLGYDPSQKVTVDNHFDSATRTMVKAWQKGLGVAQTGTVSLGSVVFLPASTTVGTVDRKVGDTAGDGDAMLSLATPTQDVVINVPAGDEAEVVPGLSVGIGTVQGTVSRLQSADSNGAVVVQAVVSPASPIENATNGSGVKVTLTLQNDPGALIVPAEALVSRLDGSYAVQVKTSDGTTKWVNVELLGVSGGNVAIRSAELTEGTVILLPA